jgi:hypothetical protein
MISTIHRLIYGPKRIALDIPTLRNCHYCEKCVRAGMANRLTVHLIDDHKMPEEHAYDTVNWVFARLRDYRRTT